MFSAHADATEIVRWLRGFEHAPRMTFITHGEPAAAEALKQRINQELDWACSIPKHLESTQL
jgi:metallo-beta-lactamase family protein